MSAYPEPLGQQASETASAAMSQAQNMAERAKEKATQVMGQAQDMAHHAKESAMHAAEQCGELCNTTTTEVENFVRKHPVWAVAATVGIGYAVGLLARELLTPPPPPKNRAVRMLEDIQERLTDFLGPAYDRASHYAEDGLSAVKSGAQSLSDMKLGNRLKQFFSN
ncbi:hypothetical protein [Roseimicrobium gellanilyticum]|nr:hypothetical protein [Roseimicrobium gellanilyticum]